jgi:L,D-transpeptidase catalytic domain
MADGLTGRRLLLGLGLIAACSQDTPLPSPAAAPAASLAAPAQAAPKAAIAASARPASEFAVKAVLAPDRPIEAGDYAWDEQGAPEAPARIVVDLEAQRLYLYRGGVEIGRSSIIYGAADKPTPTGIFRILEKDADHVSNLYDAEMPYMLRLTMDGIAIHGTEVKDGNATHGCIGIPDEFAALLFSQVRLGDAVLVTNGWMQQTYRA